MRQQYEALFASSSKPNLNGNTMKKILNLTQHPATDEQIAEGVVDLSPEGRGFIGSWLTFVSVPTANDLRRMAELLANVAAGDSMAVPESTEPYQYAMIGGAPYLMSALENALIERGITPMYAFSVRESAEVTLPDGTVRKTNVFKHAGWVQV